MPLLDGVVAAIQESPVLPETPCQTGEHGGVMLVTELHHFGYPRHGPEVSAAVARNDEVDETLSQPSLDVESVESAKLYRNRQSGNDHDRFATPTPHFVGHHTKTPQQVRHHFPILRPGRSTLHPFPEVGNVSQEVQLHTVDILAFAHLLDQPEDVLSDLGLGIVDARP